MFSTCISALRNSGDERIWREITSSVLLMVFLVQLFSGVSKPNANCGAQVPHSHPDPQRMTLSKELANTRDALRTARKSLTLNTNLPRLGRCVVVAKHALRTHIHQQRQTLFNHTSSSEINTSSSSRNLWSLLRSYKTNHASSRLPLKIRQEKTGGIFLR